MHFFSSLVYTILKSEMRRRTQIINKSLRGVSWWIIFIPWNNTPQIGFFMQKLTKKYGFFTALSMVIGIVVGSGVFYKSQEILITIEGNMPLGIIAWLAGGAIMICCSLTFAVMASMFEGVGGAADYAELCCSTEYAYYFSWFLAAILYQRICWGTNCLYP